MGTWANRWVHVRTKKGSVRTEEEVRIFTCTVMSLKLQFRRMMSFQSTEGPEIAQPRPPFMKMNGGRLQVRVQVLVPLCIQLF